METGLVVVSMGLLTLASYGYGQTGLQLVGARPPTVFAVAFGLCVWVFIGGWLSLLGIAYPVSFAGFASAGAALALYHVYRSRGAVKDWCARLLRSRKIEAALFIALAAFLVVTSASPSAFNHHDDLAKYAAHADNMLESGSVYRGELGTVNWAAAGALAVIQSVIVAIAGVKYYPAAEQVFGVLLLAALLYEAARRVRSGRVLALLIASTPLVVPPQLANYSAHYIAMALIAVSLLAAFPGYLREQPGRSAVVSGVVLSAALSSVLLLKASFIPGLLILSGGLAVSLAVRLKSPLVYANFVATGFGVVALYAIGWAWASVSFWQNVIAPTLGLSQPNLVIAELQARFGAATPGADGPGILNFEQILTSLLSTQDLFYGQGTSKIHYTLAFAASALLVLAFFIRAARSQAPGAAKSWCTILQIAVLANFAFVLVFAITFGDGHAGFRYMAPYFALLPALTAWLALAHGTLYGSRPESASATSPVTGHVHNDAKIALVFVVALFAVSFIGRGTQLAVSGHQIAFAAANSAAYKNYTEYAFSEGAVEDWAQVQGVVPEGEAILAWVALPHLLDAGRNRLFAVHENGLTERHDAPLLDGVEAFERYLAEQGVSYVIWQREGFGVRSEAELQRLLADPSRSHMAVVSLRMRQWLDELRERNPVIASGSGVHVISVGEPVGDLVP